MKQQAVAIRPGWVIEFKGKPWTVTKASHIKRVKAAPYAGRNEVGRGRNQNQRTFQK